MKKLIVALVATMIACVAYGQANIFDLGKFSVSTNGSVIVGSNLSATGNVSAASVKATGAVTGATVVVTSGLTVGGVAVSGLTTNLQYITAGGVTNTLFWTNGLLKAISSP